MHIYANATGEGWRHVQRRSLPTSEVKLNMQSQRWTLIVRQTGTAFLSAVISRLAIARCLIWSGRCLGPSLSLQLFNTVEKPQDLKYQNWNFFFQTMGDKHPHLTITPDTGGQAREWMVQCTKGGTVCSWSGSYRGSGEARVTSFYILQTIYYTTVTPYFYSWTAYGNSRELKLPIIDSNWLAFDGTVLELFCWENNSERGRAIICIWLEHGISSSVSFIHFRAGISYKAYKCVSEPLHNWFVYPCGFE